MRIAALSILGVLVLACGGRTPAPPNDAPTAASCEPAVRSGIDDLMDRIFVDNTDESWTVNAVTPADGWLYTRATPGTDRVGYPRFLVAFACTPEGPRHVAVYVPATGREGWELLSTSSLAPADTAPAFSCDEHACGS